MTVRWKRLGAAALVLAAVGGGGSAMADEQERAPGGMAHRSFSVAGHHFVIPSDATALAKSGTVDLRQFDVTTPARHGAKVPQPPAANGPKVTFNYRDRAGAATTAAATFVFGIDVDVLTMVVPGSDGTATVTLPPGRYLLESTVDTPRAGTDIPSTSVLVNPELTVSTDTTVTIDATVARQVSVTVPDRRAMALNMSVNYWRLLDRGPVSSSIGSPDPTALFSAHTGPTVPGEQFATAVSAYFARPGPDGTATNSPLVYAAAWKHHNRFPTGFRKHVREADLSTVRAEHAATGPGRLATKLIRFELPPYAQFGYSINYTATPFTRVERYAGTLRWANALDEYASTEDRADLSTQNQKPTTYRPGRRYAERWHTTPCWTDPRARRTEDALLVDAALYGDQSGRAGTSDYRRASVTLHRNGDLIGTADRLDRVRFAVPAGAATYRLTTEAERDFTDLTTKTTTTWTFTALPLPTVRYEPPVDLRNQAPGGRAVVLPVQVAQGGAPRSLTIEVSYDGGTRWQPARVTGAGDHRTAHLRHPAGPGHVSLRARATDANGTTVEQTVINAYRLS